VFVLAFSLVSRASYENVMKKVHFSFLINWFENFNHGFHFLVILFRMTQNGLYFSLFY